MLFDPSRAEWGWTKEGGQFGTHLADMSVRCIDWDTNKATPMPGAPQTVSTYVRVESPITMPRQDSPDVYWRLGDSCGGSFDQLSEDDYGSRPPSGTRNWTEYRSFTQAKWHRCELPAGAVDGNEPMPLELNGQDWGKVWRIDMAWGGVETTYPQQGSGNGTNQTASGVEYNVYVPPAGTPAPNQTHGCEFAWPCDITIKGYMLPLEGSIVLVPAAATALPPEDAQPHLHFLYSINSTVNQTANMTTADGLQEVDHAEMDDDSDRRALTVTLPLQHLSERSYDVWLCADYKGCKPAGGLTNGICGHVKPDFSRDKEIAEVVPPRYWGKLPPLHFSIPGSSCDAPINLRDMHDLIRPSTVLCCFTQQGTYKVEFGTFMPWLTPPAAPPVVPPLSFSFGGFSYSTGYGVFFSRLGQEYWQGAPGAALEVDWSAELTLEVPSAGTPLDSALTVCVEGQRCELQLPGYHLGPEDTVTVVAADASCEDGAGDGESWTNRSPPAVMGVFDLGVVGADGGLQLPEGQYRVCHFYKEGTEAPKGKPAGTIKIVTSDESPGVSCGWVVPQPGSYPERLRWSVSGRLDGTTCEGGSYTSNTTVFPQACCFPADTQVTINVLDATNQTGWHGGGVTLLLDTDNYIVDEGSVPGWANEASFTVTTPAKPSAAGEPPSAAPPDAKKKKMMSTGSNGRRKRGLQWLARPMVEDHFLTASVGDSSPSEPIPLPASPEQEFSCLFDENGPLPDGCTVHLPTDAPAGTLRLTRLNDTCSDDTPAPAKSIGTASGGGSVDVSGLVDGEMGAGIYRVCVGEADVGRLFVCSSDSLLDSRCNDECNTWRLWFDHGDCCASPLRMDVDMSQCQYCQCRDTQGCHFAVTAEIIVADVYWADLSTMAQEAFATLGWDKDGWDAFYHGHNATLSSSTTITAPVYLQERKFERLSPAQQDAVKTLGFTEASFDAHLLRDFPLPRNARGTNATSAGHEWMGCTAE
ncbi:unnamed protein product [Vitrella brassicaformis CCMP3155]|uniref:Uncharacterized protein n=1 Tax=Vitrella brassicaformis (strain CCMP3155) TaxID=1169540 RepID=A0A0G4GLU2_VITBC|nr:unnamed protein product [Vitrella brassicaformis CCMP3155]|eukprot:CEM31087.1 unnamed protein product [Vitrella brassicaformis CCMP3155]